jgi:hypothetical protein
MGNNKLISMLSLIILLPFAFAQMCGDGVLQSGQEFVVNGQFADTFQHFIPKHYAAGWMRGQNNWYDYFSGIDENQNILILRSPADSGPDVWPNYGYLIYLEPGSYVLNVNAKVLLDNGRGIILAVACGQIEGCPNNDIMPINTFVKGERITNPNWISYDIPFSINHAGAYVIRLFATDGSQAFINWVTLTHGGSPVFQAYFDEHEVGQLEKNIGSGWARGQGNWADYYAGIVTDDLNPINNHLHLHSSPAENPAAYLRYEQYYDLNPGTYILRSTANLTLDVKKGTGVMLQCTQPQGCYYSDALHLVENQIVPGGSFRFDALNTRKEYEARFRVNDLANYGLRVYATDGSQSRVSSVSLQYYEECDGSSEPCGLFSYCADCICNYMDASLTLQGSGSCLGGGERTVTIHGSNDYCGDLTVETPFGNYQIPSTYMAESYSQKISIPAGFEDTSFTVTVMGNRDIKKDPKDTETYAAKCTKSRVIDLSYRLFFYCPKYEETIPGGDFYSYYDKEEHFYFYQDNVIYRWNECTTDTSKYACAPTIAYCVDQNSDLHPVGSPRDADNDGQWEVCYSRDGKMGGWLDPDVNEATCDLLQGQIGRAVEWFDCNPSSTCEQGKNTFSDISKGLCCGDDLSEFPVQSYVMIGGIPYLPEGISKSCCNKVNSCVDSYGNCRDLGYSQCISEGKRSICSANNNWVLEVDDGCEDPCTVCNVNKAGESANRIDWADLASIKAEAERGTNDPYYDANKDSFVNDADVLYCSFYYLMQCGTCGDNILQPTEGCDYMDNNLIYNPTLCPETKCIGNNEYQRAPFCTDCQCYYQEIGCSKDCGAGCSSNADCQDGLVCNPDSCQCEEAKYYACAGPAGSPTSCHQIDLEIFKELYPGRPYYTSPSCEGNCDSEICIPFTPFPTCRVGADSESSSEFCLVSVYEKTDSYVGLCDGENAFTNKLWCPANLGICEIECGINQAGTVKVFSLYQQYDSLVTMQNTNYNVGCKTKNCNSNLVCGVTSTMLECYRDYHYCVGSVSDTEDALFGECGQYAKQVCCRTNVQTCTSNSNCRFDEYCRFPDFACGGTGVCANRPVDCSDDLYPVCGCDSTTYSNQCFMAQAGQSKKSDGICGISPIDPDPIIPIPGDPII